jgi:peptide/nickel transport system substrate-binding protein
MKQDLGAFAVVTSLLVALFVAQPAFAQKRDGILRVHQWDSPPSLSIHEEVTIATVVPMMGVFNNLVMYDQHVPQNSLQSIIPDLATSWSWSEDGAQLTFRLRDGVKWHDGRPFTAKDVQCTWDLLLGKSQEKLRTNPRKAWYQNLEEITTEGDLTAIFHLKRPQPALIALLASGYSPIYPCHVSPRDMRQRPVGTGPFKFVEFKPNASIKVVRNPGLLEGGPALPRRHRIHDHTEPIDGDIGFHRGKVRYDLPLSDGDHPAAQGHKKPGTGGGMRAPHQ